MKSVDEAREEAKALLEESQFLRNTPPVADLLIDYNGTMGSPRIGSTRWATSDWDQYQTYLRSCEASFQSAIYQLTHGAPQKEVITQLRCLYSEHWQRACFGKVVKRDTKRCQ